jgi:hypothetical protein
MFLAFRMKLSADPVKGGLKVSKKELMSLESQTPALRIDRLVRFLPP